MEKLKPQEQTKPMTTQEKTNADLARLLGIKPKHQEYENPNLKS